MDETAAQALTYLLTHPPYAQWRDPNPDRAKVTALEHATQAATRAERGGYPPNMVLACLLHDAARPLSAMWHGQVMAQILTGVVRPGLVDAIRHHGDFQFDLLFGTTRTHQWLTEPWYHDARDLAAIDAASFDPLYPALPFTHFESLLR